MGHIRRSWRLMPPIESPQNTCLRISWDTENGLSREENTRPNAKANCDRAVSTNMASLAKPTFTRSIKAIKYRENIRGINLRQTFLMVGLGTGLM